MHKILKKLLPLSSKKSVLLVDDDKEYLENQKNLLKDIFAHVVAVSNGKEAFEIYTKSEEKFDILITDLYMPDVSGIELIKKIQAINKYQAVLVVSAYECISTLLECINLNISRFIFKPSSADKLFNALYEVLTHLSVQEEAMLHIENLEHLMQEKDLLIQDRHRAIHKMRVIDSVTNLPNYSSYMNYLDTLAPKKEVTCFLFDIDNFTLINKTFGFDKGNEILKKVAELLVLNRICNQAKLFRYISDKFLLLCIGKLENLTEALYELQAFFQNTPILEFDEESLHITLSCGIAVSSDHSRIVFQAEEALKVLKQRGIPNQSFLYDNLKTDVKHTQDNFFWLKKIRKALEEERVVPYYHPIVDNTSQKIVSYECLARIEEGEKLIYPVSFLEAVKKGALMCSMTKAMIKRSFKKFSEHKDTFFSINITYQDLLDIKFLDYLEMQQKMFNINPNQVIFEILENIILDETDTEVLQKLLKLKELGYKLALDDFGSDKSNFSRFEHIGVDYIKIDGQFIQGIHNNELNQNIVKTLVRLAKDLGLKVVAEFVSNEQEYLCVKMLGVDYSQGYYFHKPSSELYNV